MRYTDANKAEAWVQVSLHVAPDFYELRVSDNGVGLPPGKAPELFELLYRAAPTRVAGVGVGLAIVKALVEQSGGSLTADSGAGQGSAFIAVLPRFDVDDFLM